MYIKNKDNKGVTLITLAVTIIVMIILSVVSIEVLFGNNGIITMSKKAKQEHLKATYFESLLLEISEEQFKLVVKSEENEGYSFIESLQERFKKNLNWVKEVLSNGKDLIIVDTNDGYEIYIDVDCENEIAEIREESFRKIQKGIKVVYDANGGEGNEVELEGMRKGFNIILKDSDTFTRKNYSFVGWSLDKNDFTNAKLAGTIYEIPNDAEDAIIFYAMWSEFSTTLTINLNGGTSATIKETQEVQKGTRINLDELKNSIIPPEGYRFAGWKYGDGTEIIETTINVNDETTIVAQWIDGVAPTIKITAMENSEKYLFAINAQVTIEDDNSGVDYSNCKYVFTTTNAPIGSNIEKYTDGTITNIGIIEQLKGPERYYLHVLATDNAGNSIEKVSSNTVTIAHSANYEYLGKEQTALLLPGEYKLECWGAQGGNIHNLSEESDYNVTTGDISYVGGYGGYSTGNIVLNEIEDIYIYVGGQGTNSIERVEISPGGFNGGGAGGAGLGIYNCFAGAGGGGATHIATISGELKDLKLYKDSAGTNKSKEILIVAGGGGGALNHNFISKNGGSAGGYIGVNGITNRPDYSSPIGGTQNTGFSFGQGGSGNDATSGAYDQSGSAGGGGGFYGGYADVTTVHSTSGAGGSGYIGSPLLTNKYMAGFYDVSSNEIDTKTITLTDLTTQVSSSAEKDKAKIGNGCARITNIN